MGALKNKRNLFFSLLLNSFVFTLFLCFTNLYYDMADSEIFSVYIAEGYYNIAFTNYFLCALCGFIQGFIYPINSFVVVELVLTLFSFIMITYVFSEKFGIVKSFLIMVFLYGFFGVNHYSTISFTLTPAILCAAGFLCLIHFCLKEKKWLFGSIIGIVLLCFASMYRFMVYEAALLVAGVFYITYCIIRFSRKGTKLTEKLKKIFNKKFIILFLVLILSTFLLNYLSSFINNSSEELRYANEYTALRSSVWDHRYIDYHIEKEAYDAIGVSENDLKMLEKMYMDDEGAFSVDNLKEIRKIREENNAENSSFVSIFVEMVKVEVSDAIFAVTDKGMLIWAFVIAIVLFFFIMRRRNYVVSIALTGLLLIIYYGLWISGRCLYRAVYGCVLCAIVFLIYSIDFNECRNWVKNLRKRKSFNIIVIVGTIAISAVMLPLSFSCNLHMEEMNTHFDGYNEVLSMIKENSDKKYMFSKGSSVVTVDNYKNPLLISVPEYLENTISFDGTYYRTPYSNQKVKEFGTDNLYSYIIDNENVFFIDSADVNYYKCFETYLNEHYSKGKQIEMELENTIGDYNIYSVVSK